MRISKRAQEVSIAQTYLNLELYEYQDKEDINDPTMLQRVALLLAKIAAAKKPGGLSDEWAPTTRLDKMVAEYQKEKDLTDIEVMQALHEFCQGKLKYMLRFERHGNYDKGAMEE